MCNAAAIGIGSNPRDAINTFATFKGKIKQKRNKLTVFPIHIYEDKRENTGE